MDLVTTLPEPRDGRTALGASPSDTYNTSDTYTVDTYTPAASWLRRCESAAPPQLEDWLRYWNDGDTDIGNLRNLEHWLTRPRASPNNS
jgi:hypothetical protein